MNNKNGELHLLASVGSAAAAILWSFGLGGKKVDGVIIAGFAAAAGMQFAAYIEKNK